MRVELMCGGCGSRQTMSVGDRARARRAAYRFHLGWAADRQRALVHAGGPGRAPGRSALKYKLCDVISEVKIDRGPFSSI